MECSVFYVLLVCISSIINIHHILNCVIEMHMTIINLNFKFTKCKYKFTLYTQIILLNNIHYTQSHIILDTLTFTHNNNHNIFTYEQTQP